MTYDTRNPTATRRALGLKLHALRKASELTEAQAAERAGISTSKLSKIERAQFRVSQKDVLALIGAYGGISGGQREDLLAMVREGSRREWWEGYRTLHPKFGSYLGLESAATTLHAYHTHLVHGLLQTPGYARAVIRGTRPDLLEHEIGHLVESRLRRQEVMTRDDPPPLTLWAIMDEAVLRRQIGGREIMHAQLERLAEAAALPNVNLLVMPDDLAVHPGLDGPLAILQFQPDARPVAYVEAQAGNFYMDKDDNLRRCQQTIHHIMAAALGPERSLAMIQQAAKEMTP